MISLTIIIPRARMSIESASWAIDSEAIRVRGIIVLVKSNQLVKNMENKKKIGWLKLDFHSFLQPKSLCFLLLGGYNI